MRSFVQYYDATYSDKDYRKDNEIFRGLIKPSTRPKILEVGSGTGNQSLLIAEWADVVAVELDADFSEIMRQKIATNPSIKLFEGDIGNLQEYQFDGAGAFFNVINYIHGRDALAHFFNAICARLKLGAVLAFDMWHAEAVLSDPPAPTTRIKHYDNYLGAGEVTQTIVPTMDNDARMVRLDYNIRIDSSDGSIMPAPFVETINMFLWLEDEIADILQEAGFGEIAFYDGRDYPEPLRPDSWHSWVISRK